ncbi:RagB/SusD family nutrient uptake outer membrane protein [Flavobacterium noncentrifugens]|uniref:SusD family protein n=1 Tax=Flavobacterium noncentrifugens TaxID=1128970 RepID=A0A1G8WA56_9FLAO|nr:RagB/SusD family nutrient uptake outer membrane protein [Flavobacterium noncentrifugens]SDJ74460.1 SusD family protein [Flavobacterium noncentrifugens]
MKKNIFLMAGFALMLASCNDDYLDINREDQIQAVNFFQTSEDAQQATAAIYANLRTWELNSFATFTISIASDDAEKGSTPGDASFFNAYNNYTFSPTEGQINDYWKGQYRGINLCNQVISNLPGIAMDETLKARLIAEARFVRGYHYFNLVRTYGGVPIYNGLPADGNYNIPRNTSDEVYAFIIADLAAAREILPTSYSAVEVGRATKGAANAYLSKVYLYKKDWALALQYSNEVIGGGYDLLPNYNSVFRIANENSVESIFEAQANFVAGNCTVSNSQYSQTQGVAGQFGWGFNVPSNDLAASYETGDVRRDATILFRGETTPEGDLINATGANPMYNQKSYVPLAQIGPGCSEGSEQNVRLMRFAEVLLINAEAANESGNTTLAQQSLNKVRTRAGLANTTANDQATIRTAIWKERRSEMAMEGDRFWDVVRQGRGAEVFGPLGFTAGKNEIFPIPFDAVSLSNNVLTQNPGY